MIMFGRRPIAQTSVIPGGLSIREGMRRPFQTHIFKRSLRIRMIGRYEMRFRRRGLNKHGVMFTTLYIWDRDRKPVSKALYAIQCAEIVIKGPVFLSQDYNMFDILDSSGLGVRRNFQSPRNRRE